MIMLTDETINNTKQKPIDGRELSDIIEGYTIAGAEPIDYPITDGILLHLKDGRGVDMLLEIGVDPFPEKENINPFYISVRQVTERSGAA